MRVRETVPDPILDRADAVELVDLTPDDLIQRLKEGKVYVPKQAAARARALLLARQPDRRCASSRLRRTAERVDEQLLAEMQARAIQGPVGRGRARCWSASARTRARRRWCATPSASPIACTPLDGAVRRDRRSLHARRGASATASPRPLRLAERLGGEAITVPGGDTPRRRRRDRLRARPTTSPRSSSASRRGRAGSRSCTARWCTT